MIGVPFRRLWTPVPQKQERFESTTVSPADLQAALDGGQFRVHYQPEVVLSSGTVVGVEALVRWSHPTRGLLAPAAFIPQLEASRVLVPFGRWVLHEACLALARMQVDNPMLRMNVNVSPRQLSDDLDWADIVLEQLKVTGVAASNLTLEITETAMMRDPGRSHAVLQTLRRAGVQVAIDDFGTGYSSLAQLSDLPASIIKLDKRFIDDLHRGFRQEEIVRCVIALAGSLGMTVTAEGVETVLQARMLESLGCFTGQGFYFSRPVPEELLLPQLLRAPQAGPVIATAIPQAQQGLVARAGLEWDGVNDRSRSVPPRTLSSQHA